MEACTRDELTARDQISKQWAQFSQTDKTRCIRLATLGSEPSYVELLTCLEMSRDARKLPEHNENRVDNQPTRERQ